MDRIELTRIFDRWQQGRLNGDGDLPPALILAGAPGNGKRHLGRSLFERSSADRRHLMCLHSRILRRGPFDLYSPMEVQLREVDSEARKGSSVFLMVEHFEFFGSEVKGLGLSRRQSLALLVRYLKLWANDRICVLLLIPNLTGELSALFECDLGRHVQSQNLLTFPLHLRAMTEEDRKQVLLDLLSQADLPTDRIDFMMKVCANYTCAELQAFVTGLSLDLLTTEGDLSAERIVTIASFMPEKEMRMLRSDPLNRIHTFPYQTKRGGRLQILTDNRTFAKGKAALVGRDDEMETAITLINRHSSESKRPLGLLITGEGSSYFSACLCEELERPYMLIDSADVHKSLVGLSEKTVAGFGRMVAGMPNLILIFQKIDQWFLSKLDAKTKPNRMLKCFKDLFTDLAIKAPTSLIICTCDAPSKLPPEIKQDYLLGNTILLEALSSRFLREPQLAVSFLEKYLAGRIDKDVDVEKVVGSLFDREEKCSTLTPSDLTHLIEEAAVECLRQRSDRISTQHLIVAARKVQGHTNT